MLHSIGCSRVVIQENEFADPTTGEGKNVWLALQFV